LSGFDVAAAGFLGSFNNVEDPRLGPGSAPQFEAGPSSPRLNEGATTKLAQSSVTGLHSALFYGDTCFFAERRSTNFGIAACHTVSKQQQLLSCACTLQSPWPICMTWGINGKRSASIAWTGSIIWLRQMRYWWLSGAIAASCWLVRWG